MKLNLSIVIAFTLLIGCGDPTKEKAELLKLHGDYAALEKRHQTLQREFDLLKLNTQNFIDDQSLSIPSGQTRSNPNGPSTDTIISDIFNRKSKSSLDSMCANLTKDAINEATETCTETGLKLDERGELVEHSPDEEELKECIEEEIGDLIAAG